MTEPFTEMTAPRRSSRISAQARPEPAPKRARKTASKPKGIARKRGPPADEADETDGDAEREQDAKKVKLPAAEDAQAMPVDEPAAGTGEALAVVEAEAPSTAAPAASEALVTIDVGGTLPSLVLKNERGDDVDTGSITTDKGVVLFLVPKADTPGCTTQACGFRDVWQEFGALDYGVYCLSADTPAAQTKWQTKKQLPYSLLSDPQRTLIGALGAAEGNKTKRSHFVFEKGGKLLDRKMPVKPGDSPRLALEFIKGLGN